MTRQRRAPRLLAPQVAFGRVHVFTFSLPRVCCQMGWPNNTPRQEATCREREYAYLGKWSLCVQENGATVTTMENGHYHADTVARKLEVARHRKLRQECAITLI